MPSSDITYTTRDNEIFDGYLSAPDGDGKYPGILLITAIFGSRPTAARSTYSSAFVALCGCAGGRHQLHFDTVEVPVSLSASVLDQSGMIAPRSRQNFKGRFEGEYVGWSILWTFVPMTRIDLSEDINARVAALGGNAVVRLRAEVDPGAKNSFWNKVLWINMLPFWPGTVTVLVDADVVEVVP